MKPECLGRGGRYLGPHAYGDDGRMRFLTVDSALASKNAAFIDDQRTDDDVAEDLSGGEDLEPAAGAHVALDAAAHHDVAAADIAFDPAMLTHREVAFRGQVAEHLTVEADVGC